MILFAELLTRSQSKRIFEKHPKIIVPSTGWHFVHTLLHFCSQLKLPPPFWSTFWSTIQKLNLRPHIRSDVDSNIAESNTPVFLPFIVTAHDKLSVNWPARLITWGAIPGTGGAGLYSIIWSRVRIQWEVVAGIVAELMIAANQYLIRSAPVRPACSERW